MMNFLLIAVIVLAVLTVAQIIRLLNLSSKLGGKNADDITTGDNNRQGTNFLIFMILFMVSVFYMTYRWWDVMLPPASSEHGVEYDGLMQITMIIICLVFLITQPMLFWFAFKYRGVKGRKATFFSHNNKLELIWTVIPAVALAVLITYGLSIWNDVMFPNTKDKETIYMEVYAKQFDWTARYAGADNKLGKGNVRYVGGNNITGLVSKTTTDARLKSLSEDIASAQKIAETSKNAFKVKNAEENIKKLMKMKKSVQAIALQSTEEALMMGEDDIQVKEIHLPINKQVQMRFRSQDIIHSAYMPHFRVQMNCVPGAETLFTFTPTKTTADMKAETGDDKFEYVLMCNKICGAAHYNMQIKVVVEDEASYQKWLSEQKTLISSL